MVRISCYNVYFLKNCKMQKVLRDASTSIRKTLASCYIKTVASLISCEAEKVAGQSDQKKEFHSVQNTVVGQFSCFPISGNDLLSEVMSTFFILSTEFTSFHTSVHWSNTKHSAKAPRGYLHNPLKLRPLDLDASLKSFVFGCDHWDELLDGGLYSGEVTEIVGSAGSGKTQVCMSIAASVAMNIEKNVLYIDTQAAFSSDRIKEMLHSRDSSLTGQDITNILSRVKHIQTFDIFELISCLSGIKESIYSEDQGFYNNLRLIIVDSVASIITPILGGQQIHGHSLMVHLSRSLKSLALHHGLSVMVTNNVVSDALSARKVKPALGQTWSHIPNTRIFIQKATSDRIATVTKSSRQPTEISTTFFIKSAGVQDFP